MEVLFHPQDRYSSVRIEDKDAKLKATQTEVETLKEAATTAQAALNEKDEEIARLKAELAKMKGDAPASEEKPKKESKKKEK